MVLHALKHGRTDKKRYIVSQIQWTDVSQLLQAYARGERNNVNNARLAAAD
jgi:hypothetical protein